jgi:hypothetical protein
MRAAAFALAVAMVLGTVHAQQPAPAPAGLPTLDFDYFKTRVQPVFLHKRPERARCYVCHSRGTPLVLQQLSPGETTWDDEQSKKNFAAIRRVVVPGNVRASRLLMMPLAEEAGGVSFHPGGKHWMTQDDPEFKVVAAWIIGAK